MEVTQDNYGYDITLTVTKKDGTVEPLTGVSAIYFQVADADTLRNIINGACTVVNAAGGICKYTVQQNDFAKAGNFLGTLLIQYSLTKRVNTRQFYITVNKKLGSIV
jgi:hypothetical protein